MKSSFVGNPVAKIWQQHFVVAVQVVLTLSLGYEEICINLTVGCDERLLLSSIHSYTLCLLSFRIGCM
jgi:hypothetical protein